MISKGWCLLRKQCCQIPDVTTGELQVQFQMTIVQMHMVICCDCATKLISTNRRHALSRNILTHVAWLEGVGSPRDWTRTAEPLEGPGCFEWTIQVAGSKILGRPSLQRLFGVVLTRNLTPAPLVAVLLSEIRARGKLEPKVWSLSAEVHWLPWMCCQFFLSFKFVRSSNGEGLAFLVNLSWWSLCQGDYLGCEEKDMWK